MEASHRIANFITASCACHRVSRDLAPEFTASDFQFTYASGWTLEILGVVLAGAVT